MLFVVSDSLETLDKQDTLFTNIFYVLLLLLLCFFFVPIFILMWDGMATLDFLGKKMKIIRSIA